ncbi:MAG: inverse autotransporter beta domain-containing protein [Candidatus Omnitrophica bacterium]|nr:inverse autotransporter beta domain-containing protein [Candidatus Omnitrophota bacterium]
MIFLKINRKIPACLFYCIAVLIFILSCCLFVPVCFSQQFLPSEYPGQARMGLRHGKNNNETWVYTDFFIPIYNYDSSITFGSNEWLLFLNPKLVLSDGSTDEENFGAGLRYLCADVLLEDGFILGANFYYDSKYSKNGLRHSQLGLGAEFLSKNFDLRYNYYKPTTEKKVVCDYYELGETSLNEYLKVEEALPGYDIEAGIPVPILTHFIETWAYGGIYRYTSDLRDDVDGTRWRLEINPAPAFAFTLEINDDNVSGKDTFVGGHVSLRFDIADMLYRRNPFEDWQEAFRFRRGPRELTERMTEPVVRDIDIWTADKAEVKKIKDMIYVDNANDGDVLENGTLSHPHNTLAEAFTNASYSNGVWIYVKRGDGTATGYTGNFTLSDNVVIWGQGYRYLDIGGEGYPVIDGGGTGNVLTLANNNTIMGVQVQNGKTGIYGKNITGVEIKNNVISDNGVGFGPGIDLRTDGANTMSARITDNTIASNNGNGITFNSDDTSTLTATISSNIISSNSAGIYHWSGTSSKMSTTISGNNISNNTSVGIYLQSNSYSTLDCFISRNTISSNSSDGVYIDDVGFSVLTLDLGNGTLGSGGYNSIYSNSGKDVDNKTSLTIQAENNWWGSAKPTATRFTGSVDYDPLLESNPN